MKRVSLRKGNMLRCQSRPTTLKVPTTTPAQSTGGKRRARAASRFSVGLKMTRKCDYFHLTSNSPSLHRPEPRRVKVDYSQRVQVADSDPAQGYPAYSRRQRCCRHGQNRQRENGGLYLAIDREIEGALGPGRSPRLDPLAVAGAGTADPQSGQGILKTHGFEGLHDCGRRWNGGTVWSPGIKPGHVREDEVLVDFARTHIQLITALWLRPVVSCT